MDAPTHVAYACTIVQGRADRYQLWTRACPCRECRTGLAQQRCQAPLPCLVAGKRFDYRDRGRSVALGFQQRTARSQGQGAGQSSSSRPLPKP